MAWKHNIFIAFFPVSALCCLQTPPFLQMRSSLSGMTGLNVDASILDEARINRPGAKTYEYKNAPQFGTYRCEAAPASDRRACARSRRIAQASCGQADEGRAG